jgi:predicted dehydrogenase
MRLALLSYSHHGRGMARVARQLGHEIVGVMDGEDAPRRLLGDEFQCPAYPSAEDCLDAGRPDAVLVAGKHIEMPSHIEACVARRLPFVLDKPFADCAARLRPVAEACIRHGVFSALTLPNRASRLVALMQRMTAEGTFGELALYSSRLNNGPPSRYDPTPSAWHSDPSVSGGGCWAVEAAHGLDTFLQFVGSRPISVVGAVMSNAIYGRTVEDMGVGVLRTDNGVTGIIETGYSYPSGARSGDHFFRFVGSKASLFERYDQAGEPVIELHTPQGVTFQPDISNNARFQAVIGAALAAIQDERSFEPNIADAVRILELQDAVYTHARANPLANGPHALGLPAPLA